jgi:hypothetical protein
MEALKVYIYLNVSFLPHDQQLIRKERKPQCLQDGCYSGRLLCSNWSQLNVESTIAVVFKLDSAKAC